MRWYIMGTFFNPKGMRNHSKCPSAQTNADTLRALKVTVSAQKPLAASSEQNHRQHSEVG
ncbi:hypothetical protein PC120_g23830 [Phytophthora cactorum]|nr:hypothetical protein PC120_g23830 [Phytophthora cactorum]